jgi:hypothetical protein
MEISFYTESGCGENLESFFVYHHCLVISTDPQQIQICVVTHTYLTQKYRLLWYNGNSPADNSPADNSSINSSPNVIKATTRLPTTCPPTSHP